MSQKNMMMNRSPRQNGKMLSSLLTIATSIYMVVAIILYYFNALNGVKLNRSRNRNKEKLTKKIEEFQEDLKTSKPKDVETIEAIAENERTQEQIEILNKWNEEVEKLASEKFEIELQTFDFDKADELNQGADSNVFNSVEFFLIDKED